MAFTGDLTTFNKIYPLYVDKFESLIPIENMSVTDKINSVIQHLNRVGKLSNDAIKDWNSVMKWLMEDGLGESVNEKVDQLIADGKFDELLQGMNDEINAGVDLKLSGFETQLAQIVQLRNYAKGDGTDETIKIQQALNESVGKILYWNKQSGTNYVTNPLTIPSNTHIIFQSGTLVKAKTGYTASQSLLSATGSDNIIIEGNFATLQMLKSEYTTGEQRHCTYFIGNENVVIKDLILKDSGGDGILIGGNGIGKTSKNIRIINCSMDNHRRQGISVVGDIENVIIDGCHITNINGTAPQAGIDIEPNDLTHDNKNITVKNCTLENNVLGIQVLNNSYDVRIFNNKLYNSNSISVTTFNGIGTVSPSCEVYNNKISNSSGIGVVVQDAHDIKVYNNEIYNPTSRGVYVTSTVLGTTYKVDVFNNKLFNTGSHGISVVDCHDISVFGNTVKGTATARKSIYVQQSAITSSTYSNKIFNNIVNAGGDVGIELDTSTDSEVRDNLIQSCVGTGLLVGYSSTNTIIKANTITDSGDVNNPACKILNSSFCTIRENKIRKGTKSPNYGLHVDVNSSTAIIENNDLQNSGTLDLFKESASAVVKSNTWLDGSTSPYRNSTLPTANSGWLGTTVLKINSGADDTLHVCIKNSSGSFVWNTVEINSGYQIKPINYLTEASLITAFDDGKITTFRVNGTNPFNGSSGIVTTYRLSGNGWDRQEFRKYLSNEVWSRYTDGTGAWTTWVKISAV